MLHQLSVERSCQNDYKICIRTNISYVFIQLDFHKLRDLCLWSICMDLMEITVLRIHKFVAIYFINQKC